VNRQLSTASIVDNERSATAFALRERDELERSAHAFALRAATT